MTSVREPKLRVAKDGTRTWQVRFREGGRGSRDTSQTFVREKDAAQFCRWLRDYGAVEALHQLAQRQAPVESVRTVADWCTDHVDHLTGVTPGTVGRYRTYIRDDLGTLAGMPLVDVTPRHVGAWVVAMEKTIRKGKPPSGKTIKNKHGFLSAAMNGAVSAGLIPSNPCRGTRLPTTITEPMVFLSRDENVRFLGCFPAYWLPLVETLFGTGMRWGEATALRVGDLDCDAGTATVVRAWKRGPDGWAVGAPKSRRSRRTISLAGETVAVLRPLVDGRPADALVFINRRGQPVRGNTFHDEVWQPAVRLANGEPARARKRIAKRDDLVPLDPPIGKRPRVHDARHSCASWLLGAGVPINYVQAHLGHESITTTVDRYGHVMPASRQVISQALSLTLSQSAPEADELTPQTSMTPSPPAMG